MKRLIFIFFLVPAVIFADENDATLSTPSSTEISTTEVSSEIVSESTTKVPLEVEEYGCDETLFVAQNITSTAYPEPYPGEGAYTWCLNITKGTGIQILIENIDIDPQADFLLIQGLGLDEVKKQYVTGNKPMKFLFTNTNQALIHFKANQKAEHKFKGFFIQILPYGESDSSTEAPSTTTERIYTDNYDIIVRDLIISKEQQKDPEVFDHTIRQIFVDSTNQWLVAHDLDERMEKCRKENVKLDVIPCPRSWPNNDNCVRMEIGIPLNESDYDIITKPESDVKIDPPYELSKLHLEMIWNEFAMKNLEGAGFGEYKLPGQKKVLIIWTSVSVIVIGAFICVLYGIWKLEFFKDYKRMSEEKEVEGSPSKRKSSVDPSLFPSPNQIIPPFLSEQDNYTGFDPKFAISTELEDDSVFDVRQQRNHGFRPQMMSEFNEHHPHAYRNPFESEIEASEYSSNQGRSFQNF